MIKTMITLSAFALASASSESSFTVALPQRNVDVLEQAVLNMSNYKHMDYGKFWTIDQVLDLIAPCPGINAYVNEYFMERNISCTDHRDAMVCVGDTTPYRQYKSGVPPELKGYVTLIDGLHARPSGIVPKERVKVKTGGVDPGYVGVESVRKLYSIPNVSVNEEVVAVEYQGSSGFSNDDLTQSQKQNGLQVKPITSNHTVGADGFPDTETELDVQMLTYANNVSVWYWGSEQWLLTWAVNFFNTPVVPYVASHSWGWAVDQQCTINPCNTTDQVYVNRVNVEYLKIAARGVTMLTASGDSGASGRSDEGCQGVNRTVIGIFPGSSPYVLSVGATFVETGETNTSNWSTPLCQQYGCTTGSSEAVVNFANVSWTAGGGFGAYETEVQPVWQAEAVNGYFNQSPPLPTHFNAKGRAYPDISVVGHNCPTWQDGLSPVDGTSCSSPLMGSIVALLNSHQLSNGKSRLGLAAPVFYAMYYDDSSIYHDIVVGNNWCTESLCCPVRGDGGSEYGYVATDGYDPVSGLGTPNVTAMLLWLDRNT
jgi:tripeptidyl-peptidase-1